mgnify:CR=1 FL=1
MLYFMFIFPESLTTNIPTNPTMDPLHSLQDVIQCDLCETPLPLSTVQFVKHIYVKPV